MTKEELEKEAEEKYGEVDREFIACQDEGEVFNIGYVLGAEPREKRIAELEKENTELKADFIKSCKVKEQGFREAEQALERKDEQLTKAKELLAKWVELFKPKGGNMPPTPIQVKTEQFLSEVEK